MKNAKIPSNNLLQEKPLANLIDASCRKSGSKVNILLKDKMCVDKLTLSNKAKFTAEDYD